MIVPATAAHAPALALIHAASFPASESWGPDAMELQLALPGAFGLIDPAGGMILVRTAADEAEILTLAVAPEARRRGIARSLLAAAMTRAEAAGATTLFLEVATSNTAARALYAATGFTEVGHRRNYYPGGAAALVLRASLTPAATPPK
jgi:ribosomal-protein-alanine N-acetyltransferase